jgi:nucleotide-binding universal stress UspA family protein
MYRRILVAVDGSETSSLALDHALQLAQDQRARVRIVHALESLHQLLALSGGTLFDVDELLDSLRREGQRVLAASLERAKAFGVDAETGLIEPREPVVRTAQMLVQEARSWDADLIVVGTHGRSGVNRLFVGSVAETVLRGASVPVLLVRHK